MKSIDLKNGFSIEEESLNLPNIQAENKGEIILPSLRLNNAISIKTKNFFLPILQSNKIKFDAANIYIVDLDSIFGSVPSTFMKNEMLVNLLGKDLLRKYEFNFSTSINFDPGYFVKDSAYLKVSGSDLFKINLNIQKNSLPILKINSDLKNIELNSPLSSLSKKKLTRLPTKIFVTNFSNPSIKVINQNFSNIFTHAHHHCTGCTV